MFARTKRLLLRPGWPEDAADLTQAIGHAAVARNLSRVPWPYATDDAAAFLALPRCHATPRFLIFDRPDGDPRLVGGIAIDVGHPVLGNNLGYWLTPSVWGRGYATEAGRAVVDMARHALALDRLNAGHFADNPASGRVLAKLGFEPTGAVVRLGSLARGGEVESPVFELDLAASRSAMPLAA